MLTLNKPNNILPALPVWPATSGNSSKIHLDANLYEDLDLDSIDAVDLVVKLRDLTGKKIDPDAFKAVRTVGHIVDEIYNLIEA
jgi:acyl carrier protein